MRNMIALMMPFIVAACGTLQPATAGLHDVQPPAAHVDEAPDNLNYVGTCKTFSVFSFQDETSLVDLFEAGQASEEAVRDVFANPNFNALYVDYPDTGAMLVEEVVIQGVDRYGYEMAVVKGDTTYGADMWAIVFESTEDHNADCSDEDREYLQTWIL